MLNVKNLVFFFSAAPLFFSSQPTLAQSARPGFLEDFSYHVVNLSSMAEAENLIKGEIPYYAPDSVCADRAQIWAYKLSKMFGLKIGKVFIHFTDEGSNAQNEGWTYHVAPYVLINGEEYVLDTVFPVFNRHPVKLSEWTKYFGNSENCVVLNPRKNPKHLRYELNNVGDDSETPLAYGKAARRYPGDEGQCYIRKTPMYYQFPVDVYGADLAFSGDAKYLDFIMKDFDRSAVKKSCELSMPPYRVYPLDCGEYLGI